jgi:hypothetical protein
VDASLEELAGPAADDDQFVVRRFERSLSQRWFPISPKVDGERKAGPNDVDTHLASIRKPPLSSRPDATGAGDRAAVPERGCKVAGKWKRYTCAMIVLRLSCSAFWVEVRLREINGRWIASADTPDGPSLGVGEQAIDAIAGALMPFEGIVDELLASVPLRRIE